MRAWLLAAATLGCLLAGPVRADELTPMERTWARACVTGLTAASARQRESAAAALARLGPAAVPAVVSAASALKTDEHWAALEKALVGMGAAEALKELEKVDGNWPGSATGRKRILIEHLRATVTAGTPDAIAAKVRAILETFERESTYTSGDRRVTDLVRLGRPAVPALLEDLKRAESHSFRPKAASEALRRLLVVEDVPTVARMLEEGHLDVAPALSRLPAEVVVPALVAPLSKGYHSFALVEGLTPFKSDKRVQVALIRWLEADPDADGSSLIGSTARLLGEADVRDAVPTLLAIVERGVGSMNRREVAEALVTLGERRGIEVLLDLFRSIAPARPTYDRHAAGERLNDVVGRRIYRGTSGPGGESDGNYEEALAQFDAWWAEVRDTIRYDPDRRAWVTK